MLPAILLLFLTDVGRAADPADFDRDIAPLLARRCLDCHSGFDAKAKLDLSTAKGLAQRRGDGPAVVPFKPADSLLWQRVESGEMPPKNPLPAAERALLKSWIERGATWGSDPIDPYRHTTADRAGYDWWSLQPLVRPVPTRAVAHPVDAFVRAKLAASGLQPAAPADRRTLIRRVTFDLVGLPPTPEEIERFADDPSPDAYAKLVDRLLVSPHYGERWARHWLDVARFGESDGFEYDRMRPNAWRYRDWVIQALNADLPYDEFARLQIAGDALRPGDPDAVVATGFLVGGPHDGLLPAGDALRQVMRQDELEEIVGVVAQSFLGITANCARCHDHKFDPVRQADYYRLAAALAGVRRGERPLSLPVPLELTARIAAITDDVAAIERAVNSVGEAELNGAWSPEQLEVRQRLAAVTVHRKSLLEAKAFAVTPEKPQATYRLKRGDPQAKAELVPAGGLSAAGGTDFGLGTNAPDAERRRRLADWVAREHNPLFARTMVNRVWQYHFGRGFVDTPNDLGFSGGRPSHPELLNWLATEFIAKKWSLKQLHRTIVMSETYRQASAHRAEAAARDADNKLLWRYSPRRLEAEALRDATLAVAGQLNPTVGGPSYMDVRPYFFRGSQFYEPQDPVGPEFHRRSVYRMSARGGRNPLLDTFDCPDPSTTAPKRGSTTTPLQALSLMNNSFTLRMADALAARLLKDGGADVDGQIRLGFLLTYGRPPAEEETAASREVVTTHGLSPFCRALLNSNGFLYVH